MVTNRLASKLADLVAVACRRRPAKANPPQANDEGLLAWAAQMLPDHFTKPPSGMHRWLAEQLDAMRAERGKKVNLIGPRGGAKSTVATLAHVLREALSDREPYIWVVSDTAHQAQAHLQNLAAELTDNRTIASRYPRAAGRGEPWRRGCLRLRNGVVIEAFGTGQRVRGRRRRADRPTLIVADDLQNDQHIASARMRDASSDWFHGTLLKAGTPTTNLVNLATALHRDALAMRLHATPGWDSALFKAIEEWPKNERLWKRWEELYCDTSAGDSAQRAAYFYRQHQEEMDAGARLLWPEVEDLPTLMAMRIESGHAAFEREKQGCPIDPQRCEWPDSYFDEHAWFDEWPRGLTLKTMALDPSKGADARQGDDSAIVMLGVDADGVLHVEGDLARRPTPQMVADSVEHYLRFRPDAFGVEANQWQQLLAAEFVGEFQRRGVLGATPCEIHNYTNKAMRIRRLGPYLAQRRIRFRRGCASTERLVDQLRDFPIGTHDDGPDAFEMALRLAEEFWQGHRKSDGLGDRLPLA